MQLIKKIFYYTNKLFYYIMILFYVSITISIVYFDIVDVEGDFRKIICFPAIITFLVLYILTVELPAAVFKVKVERYDMFSKKIRQNNNVNIIRYNYCSIYNWDNCNCCYNETNNVLWCFHCVGINIFQSGNQNVNNSV